MQVAAFSVWHVFGFFLHVEKPGFCQKINLPLVLRLASLVDPSGRVLHALA